MIIRRLANAIRDQNWFTVVIEFLIIVVGIFVGLQVDEWNETRKDRISERRYLERIYDDLTADIADIEDSIEVAKGRRAMGKLLLRVLDEPELASADPLAFIRAIEQAGYTRSPTINDYTFEELKSDGKLGIIRDEELRSALTGYYKLIERYDQWSYGREYRQNTYTDRRTGILAPQQLDKIVPFDENAKFSAEEALIALERMRGKPEFIVQIPRTTHHAGDITVYTQWRDAAEDLRASIRSAIGHNDDL